MPDQNYNTDWDDQRKKQYDTWYAQQASQYGDNPNNWPSQEYLKLTSENENDPSWEFINNAQRNFDQDHGKEYHPPPKTMYFDAASGTFSAGSWNGQSGGGYNGPFQAPSAGYTGYTDTVTTRDPVGNPWQDFAKVAAIYVALIATGGAASSAFGSGASAASAGVGAGAEAGGSAGLIDAAGGLTGAGAGAGATGAGATGAGVGAGAGAVSAGAAGGSSGLIDAAGGLTGLGGTTTAGVGAGATTASSTLLPAITVTGTSGAGAVGGSGLIDAAGGLAGLGGAVAAGSPTPAAQPNYTQPSDTPPGDPQPSPTSGVGGLLSRASDFLGSPTGKVLTGIGGQVLQGIGAGKAAEAEQEAINERARYYDNQWRDPAQVQALKNAVVEGPKVSTGYLERAQRISDFLSNGRRAPGDPDKVYGSYVRGE